MIKCASIWFSFRFTILTLALAFSSSHSTAIPADGLRDEPLHEEALRAAKSATQFLTDSVATRGGYLWQYSGDLSLREGEGIVQTQTVWVQPPGTPTLGLAFVRLYEATGDEQFLNAAIGAAEALRAGQLRSGGWQDRVEFDADQRHGFAYRSEPERKKAKDQSTLDDDKTQSSIRFLARLDRATKFKIHWLGEVTNFAIDGLIGKGQLPNGGYPQVWTNEVGRKQPAAGLAASYPSTWPRTYPGHQQYWNRYTLNDDLAEDMVETLHLIEDIYGDGRGGVAAVRLADSLLLAQMPSPQPAWAQQYSDEMQPVWARKFEPPAISGGESQGVIAALLQVYARTGDRKYLPPIGRAIDYLETCLRSDQKLARFYELQTNRPLYFNQTYELTYDDAECPTHYSFVVSSRLDRLRRDYQKSLDTTWKPPSRTTKQKNVPQKEVRRIIAAMDDRGRFVSDGKLKYHRYQGPVISMKTTAENLNTLADYLAN